MNEKHDPYAALRSRDFSLFLVGSMLGTVGAEMQSVAVGWELYERTDSALALGWVGLVQALPVIVLALPAGNVADRFARRSIVIATQATMLLASLGLMMTSFRHGPVGWMYLCLFITGVAGAFSFPARWALLPELVPRSLFHNAVTWRSSGWQVAAVIGPALGGVGIGFWKDAAYVYLSDALFSVAVLACLVALRARNRPVGGGVWSWESLLAGVRFVRESTLIKATISLDMFAVLLGGAVTLLPIYAKDILRVGPAGLGWLRAAPAVGALVMALILTHRPPFRHAGPTLLVVVAGFGIATIVFGVSRSFYLSLVMLFLTGLFDNVSVVIRSTLLQALTPDNLQGRVSAVNSVFIGMSNELGSFESGVTARLLGTVASVVLGGFGSLAVVVGVSWKWPAVATLGTIEHVSHADEPTRVVVAWENEEPV